ncbi:MAG: hypothetical protein IPH22_12135 [Nitrosomonas sp.]|nr:hypothetical protein [Nitrosomonas sp.]
MGHYTGWLFWGGVGGGGGGGGGCFPPPASRGGGGGILGVLPVVPLREGVTPQRGWAIPFSPPPPPPPRGAKFFFFSPPFPSNSEWEGKGVMGL